ncbi:coat protein [ssRNA phage Gerhypos.3_15]|uniref:Coat protein n=2 Tax=Leviviricetes TaxID=2842243 RepID=A0A8S5L2I7_9VIRU|nr:coat protein [ssRNA phage Gerhypos.3_15]QDH90403.1 MAG: hypothetical protein H3Bulk42182_000002 [Leviviridae sp.]DAD51615.1 TPA_asm: coat protein [ssRNA phage Gerhypos.3_15]
MAFADPQSITITGFNGGSAISLPRTQDERLKSVYMSNDGLYQITISHQPSGQQGTSSYRLRSMFRVDVKVLATDPFNADKSIYQTAGIYIVIDKPAFGFTATNLSNMASGLVSLLTASSNAAILKLVGAEH